MKIHQHGLGGSMLILEEGQTAEIIWHLIEDNNLTGLRVVANRINPLSEETIKVVCDTTYLKNLSWWVVLKDFQFDFDFLSKYNQLEGLHIQNALSGNLNLDLLPKSLEEIRFIWDSEKVQISKKNLNLKRVQINSFDDEDCTRLIELKNLRTLTLVLDKNCKSLNGLQFLTSLKSLYVESKLRSYQNLGDLKQLSNLSLSSFNVTNIDDLKELRNLKKFTISSKSLNSISSIASLKSLETLSIYSCPKLIDFSAIGNLESLQDLEIQDCKNLSDIQFLKKLHNLKRLTLSGTTIINDYDTTPAEHVPVFFGSQNNKYNKQYPEKEIHKKLDEL